LGPGADGPGRLQHGGKLCENLCLLLCEQILENSDLDAGCCFRKSHGVLVQLLLPSVLFLIISPAIPEQYWQIPAEKPDD